MPEAVLIINPLKDKQLNAEVFCCFVKSLGLDFNVDPLEYLNVNYPKFIDAINLVGVGEIEDLEELENFQPRMKSVSFPSLSRAKEHLSAYKIFYFDTSERFHYWKWINPTLH